MALSTTIRIRHRVGIKRQSIPLSSFMTTAHLPQMLRIGRERFGVHCQWMLEAQTAKMINDWSRYHISRFSPPLDEII